MILQSHLSLRDAQLRRGVRVEDLLDLLQLDEVIGRADHAEPQPGELQHEPGQLALEPIRAVVAVEVEAPEFLDALENRRPGAEPFGRERPAVARTAQHILGRQLGARPRRIRVPLADAPVELIDPGPGRAGAS